jgi:hypothetical protein
VLTLGGERARDDLVGCVIATHGVDRDHRIVWSGDDNRAVRCRIAVS